MNRSKCRGVHDDRKTDTWTDTAGQVWHEYACDGCGRLVRRPAG